MAKQYMMLFKRDALKDMVNQGLLRRPSEFSMESHFIPQLYGQIVFDIQIQKDHIDNLDNLLSFVTRGSAKQHREAMIKEYKRREEKKKEEMRQQREREEAKKKRKEDRAAARERHRIQMLLEKIQTTMIAAAQLEDYNPNIRIYDVRDQEAKKDGVFLIGGFVGELIITFTCLLDYILANPQN